MKVMFDQGKMVMVQTAKNPKEKSTKVGSPLSPLMSLLQSSRVMVGRDELVYTMEVTDHPGSSCVQKFKRIA